MLPKPTNDKSLKEVLDETFHALHLDGKLRQHKLIASWEKVMGKAVANRTSKILFRDKKLFIYLTSASLREELLNAREKIITLLNEEAGAKIIEEIVFN